MCAFALSKKKQFDKSRLFKSTKKSADSPGRKSAKYFLENCRLHAVVFVELLKCHNSILFALPLAIFKIIVRGGHPIFFS